MSRLGTSSPVGRRGRALAAGAALLVLYVVVAVGTASFGPGRLRPLFDGFASHPGLYSWVKPPKEFAEGNRPPAPVQVRVSLAADGSSPVIAETVDGQALASLPPGAVPPHPPDGAATVDLRPVDSTTLGALPPGLRAEGNAYQVSISYLPSAARVTTLTAPATFGVTSKAASDTLLFSADGRSWRSVQGQPVGGSGGFTASSTELGYYLAASRGAPREAVSSSKSPPVLLFAVAAVVPLVLGYLLLGRRRGGSRPTTSTRPSRSPARGAGGGSGRPSATATKKPKKR